MTKTERKKLYALIEQWTRSEIMSRFAPLGWPECGDYYYQKLQLENDIRILMFGTDNLVALGQRWNLPMENDKERVRKKKKGKKTVKKHSKKGLLS